MAAALQPTYPHSTNTASSALALRNEVRTSGNPLRDSCPTDHVSKIHDMYEEKKKKTVVIPRKRIRRPCLGGNCTFHTSLFHRGRC